MVEFVIPGQLRPTFAKHDRAKRYAISIVGTVLALFALTGALDAISSHTQALSGALYFVPAVGLLVGVQMLYRVRINDIRRVRARLAEDFPESAFLVGNVRFGADPGGPTGDSFATTILQFEENCLSLWDPDSSSQPYIAMPLIGLIVEVRKTTPPRWALTNPYVPGATYLAVFKGNGLAFERSESLTKLAMKLFPELASTRD
jgi:hypothetical protein